MKLAQGRFLRFQTIPTPCSYSFPFSLEGNFTQMSFCVYLPWGRHNTIILSQKCTVNKTALSKMKIKQRLIALFNEWLQYFPPLIVLLKLSPRFST